MIYKTKKGLFSAFSLVLTTLLVSAPGLMAQGEAPTGDKNALQKWVLDGGWPMGLIALAIIALLALSVFNFINLPPYPKRFLFFGLKFSYQSIEQLSKAMLGTNWFRNFVPKTQFSDKLHRS